MQKTGFRSYFTSRNIDKNKPFLSLAQDLFGKVVFIIEDTVWNTGKIHCIYDNVTVLNRFLLWDEFYAVTVKVLQFIFTDINCLGGKAVCLYQVIGTLSDFSDSKDSGDSVRGQFHERSCHTTFEGCGIDRILVEQPCRSIHEFNGGLCNRIYTVISQRSNIGNVT